jgi:hypothetical protein
VPALKYWDGAAWQLVPGVGAGGTPSTLTYPFRGQVGSVAAAGSTNIPHFIAGAPGNAYDLPPGWIDPGTFYQWHTKVVINAVMHVGGTGSADVATFGQLVHSSGAQIGASSQTQLTHAFYWTSCLMTGEIDVPPRGPNGQFLMRMHFVGGVDVHVMGQVNWKVFVV